ncbi:hypothetical protein [Nocardioides ultimimeridianus]
MRNRLAIALSAAALMAAGPLAVPSGRAVATTGTTGTTTTITPSELPRGGAAHDYLVGRSLHPRTDGVIHLPRAWMPSQLTLVGHSAKGWIVQRVHTPTPARMRLYRVTRTRVRLISSMHLDDDWQLWFLTDDGSRIVSIHSRSFGNGDRISLLDLDGRVLYGPISSRYALDFLTASRGTVWFAQQNDSSQPGDVPTQWTVKVWHAAAGTLTALGPGVTSTLIDRPHDLLFTAADQADAPVGPTSFSSPGTPTWTAPFTPMAVSPDGRRVAGIVENYPLVDVEIRRVSDGALLRTIHTEPLNNLAGLWWESSTALLISENLRYRSWLIRCTVAGSCSTPAPSVPSSWTFTHRNSYDTHQVY